jgi:hypothetical protein
MHFGTSSGISSQTLNTEIGTVQADHGDHFVVLLQAPEIRFSFHSTYNLGNLIVSGAIRDPNLGRWLSCSLQIVLCAMDRIPGEFLQTKVGLTVDFRSVTI